MWILRIAFSIFAFVAGAQVPVPAPVPVPAAVPLFKYVANQVPDWPVATFTITRYNQSATLRNRLLIDYYNDSPKNQSIYLTNAGHRYQLNNNTPDPFGILGVLYTSLMRNTWSMPAIKMTIPIGAGAAAADLKWFIQGFKPEGVARGVPVRYVSRVSIDTELGLQFSFPLNPYDLTFCWPTEQIYKCPPGSPWNSGIPYLYPQHASLDVNDALYDAIMNISMAYGGIEDVYFTIGSVTHHIPFVGLKIENRENETKPMFIL